MLLGLTTTSTDACATPEATPSRWGGSMIYIIETILDCNGNRLAHEVLPVTFDRTADARRFMDRYIDQVYEGRGGFEAEHQSWWASEFTATVTLHQYTLVDEPRTGT